jgi:3-oxoacyl-[acyl-carrier protein] reductase
MIDKLTPRMKSEHWDPVIEVDLTGTFFLTQAVMAAMKRRESGRIITNSSVIALTGNRGQANYAAAKAGLIAVNKTWVQEYAGRPWTFNVVCPGPINTAMIQDLPDGVKESFASRIPAGFLGEPEDVASLVGYLASPRARYINGQVIAIDGGLTA